MESCQINKPEDCWDCLDGFKVVRGMLSGELLGFLGMYAFNQAQMPDAVPTKDHRGFVDDQVPNTPAWHDDLAMMNLMYYLFVDIENHTGESLCPTYSYLRVYKHGDVLKRHTDRNSCEFSMTLTLMREDGDDIWPIYLETDRTHKVELEAGDALIYKGVESPHWRNKFEGERLAQVFLHYVRR